MYTLALHGPGPAELFIILLVFVLMIAFTVLPYWFIFLKAGYPGAMALLMVVPIANVVLLFVLAFSKWPIERRLEEAQAAAGPLAAGAGAPPPTCPA